MSWTSDLAATTGHTGFKVGVRSWLFHPAFRLVTLYRWSRACYGGGRIKRLFGDMCWRKAVGDFGCYISPRAHIGVRLRLAHPVGIVIGDEVRVGDDVTLYQHVTLGQSRPNEEQYPSIGDRAILYTGCVVMGAIRIGEDAIVGANSVVRQDVPDGAIVAGVPARFIGWRKDIKSIDASGPPMGS